MMEFKASLRDLANRWFGYATILAAIAAKSIMERFDSEISLIPGILILMFGAWFYVHIIVTIILELNVLKRMIEIVREREDNSE
jgi:predicted permease